MVLELGIVIIVTIVVVIWVRSEDAFTRPDDHRTWAMRRFQQWWWRRDRDPLLAHRRDA